MIHDSVAKQRKVFDVSMFAVVRGMGPFRWALIEQEIQLNAYLFLLILSTTRLVTSHGQFADFRLPRRFWMCNCKAGEQTAREAGRQAERQTDMYMWRQKDQQ